VAIVNDSFLILLCPYTLLEGNVSFFRSVITLTQNSYLTWMMSDLRQRVYWLLYMRKR